MRKKIHYRLLFIKNVEYALGRGIIIADTKFEFGLDEDGNIVLGDEMLTGQLSFLAGRGLTRTWTTVL